MKMGTVGERGGAVVGWLLLWWALLLMTDIRDVDGYVCNGGDVKNGMCYCITRDEYPAEDKKCCRGEADKSSAFCKQLLRTDDLAWTRPFTGFRADGTVVKPWLSEHYCNSPNPQTFRMAPALRRLAKLEDYTNRLQFEPKWIAQEGLSFCIVGSHYRKSHFSIWEPLKGFLPLAEKSFDIGNNTDPDDSTKMNAFTRYHPDDLRRFPLHDNAKPLHIWHKNNPDIPTHRFEYVWLGTYHPPGSATFFPENNLPLKKGFEKRPAHPEWQPDPDCENPYKVSVTLIEADSIVLHNYLHITVRAEPTTQPAGRNCPTGRIKLLMLEVRDQDGLPVGQFTDTVPCDQDEKSTQQKLMCAYDGDTTCRAHYGTKQNQVPCMFSHPKAVVHPTIFMMAADKFENPGAGPSPTPPGDACRNSQVPQSARNPNRVTYKKNEDQYVTEVHATWRYAQIDEGWASELHFATMIIEDETPIQYYTSRLTYWAGPEHTSEDGIWEGPYNPATRVCFNVKACCWRYYGHPPNDRYGALGIGLISSCLNSTYNTNRPYGYSAQYNTIRPTFKTRGGWDYFRKEFISSLDIDCHVQIAYGPKSYYTLKDGAASGKYSVLPIRKSLKDHLEDKFTLTNRQKYQTPVSIHSGVWPNSPNYKNTFELPDWHNYGMTMHTDDKNFPRPSDRVRSHYYLSLNPKDAVLKMFDSAHQDPIVLTTEFDDKPFREYFGSRYIVPDKETPNLNVMELQRKHDAHDNEFTMPEMASESRCPCPFFPTTPTPELATKAPVEIEGRRTHVVNMLIAWVVLVPFAFFVARFYKETYSRVFFLQEFWWYTIHVFCLATALLFTFGGIYGLKAKRSLGDEYEIVWTSATKLHIYMSYALIGVYVIHLLAGAFRVQEVDLRIVQIGLHWLFGWLEYSCAMTVILSAAAIPSGCMSCLTFGIYCGFITFQLVFTLGMEYHMWKVDDELQLNPPRAYLPSPVMRLFHRDAPHSYFRVVMLGVFGGGCVLFYAAMHIAMNLEGGEFSCFQPTAEQNSN